MTIRDLTRRWVLALLVAGLVVAGCSPFPATITQGSGLPQLHHLDWGYGVFFDAAYSPDGHWIAMLAGADYATSHLEVESADGRTQYTLSGWGCGQSETFAFAWTPDNRLTCVIADNLPNRLCTGGAPFTLCQSVPLSSLFQFYGSVGAVWAPDQSYLLVAGWTRAPDGSSPLNPDLQVVSPTGDLIQMLPFSDTGGIFHPARVPHSSQLSYELGTSLVVSAVSGNPPELKLGAPRVLMTDMDEGQGAQSYSWYAWAPTGHWVAVRHGDYQGGDKIYLINVDQPTQTVDVVLADNAGQQMADPVWSPDGRTMVVFGVNDDQPYALDIAAYLHSKGLQL